MTLQNNRAHLQCYFKLCASFCTHWWIQTWVTVQKRPIWVKIDNFFSRATFKLDRWPWKTIGHLFYSELVTFFNISSQGEFRRRLAKFIANISQRHREHVSLGMLYGLKTCFRWMAFFWTAAISYLIEKIRIRLNVTFRDRHYAFGVG